MEFIPTTSPQEQVLLKAAFDDVEQFCDVAQLWDLDFKPLSRNEGDAPVADLVQIRFGQVEFGSARLRAALDQRGLPPARSHTFVILAPHMRYLWWRGHDVSPANVLVFHEGSELGCLSGSDFQNYCLSIDETYVQSVAEREKVPMPPLRHRPEVFRPSPALLAEAQGLLAAARHTQPGITEAVISDLTDRLVLTWLAHSGLRRKALSETRRAKALGRSLELLQADPRAQISIPDLCTATGVSRRTLEAAFHDAFGLGPAAFMKQRRLVSARRVLLAAGPGEVQIGDVMAQNGFAHVGQFATDYRRTFGERPSETLAR